VNAAALEDRSLKVAQATARLLKEAGVNFGNLGVEESGGGETGQRFREIRHPHPGSRIARP
jgi:Fe-S oxidoreductase